jgi:hypothetical protein
MNEQLMNFNKQKDIIINLWDKIVCGETVHIRPWYKRIQIANIFSIFLTDSRVYEIPMLQIITQIEIGVQTNAV